MRWQQVYEQGACQSVDPDTFFPDDANEMPPELEALCGGCPVRDSCLRMAVEQDLRFGIYGGRTPYQRARERRADGRTVCKRNHSKQEHGYLTSQGMFRCRACDSYEHQRQSVPYTPNELASMRNETCKSGHPWKETLFVSPTSGKKSCRKCRAAAKARDKARSRGGEGKCLQGHTIAGSNVIIYANGTRRCKQCQFDQSERRRNRRPA